MKSTETKPGFIINVAYTGAVSSKNQNPSVPYNVEEILADAIKCAELGAAIGHFHVRGPGGTATNDPVLYAELFSALRSENLTKSMILVGSTSGRHGQTLEDRMSVMNLPEATRPEMASLTLSSLNFSSGASVNPPDDIRVLAGAMLHQNVKPELEVFDLGMVAFAHRLISEGLIKPPFYFNVILGNIAGAQADLLSAAAIIAALPPNSIVCLGGIGRAQINAHLMATCQADGVRTGLEDNLKLPGSGQLATNSLLVERIANLAHLAGLLVATPHELRIRLGFDSRQ